MRATSNWKTLEETISQDIATISLYIQKWKLKLSTAKMVSAALHLNHKEGQHKLSISVKGQAIPYCTKPMWAIHFFFSYIIISLFVLAGFLPTEIRCKQTMLSLACQAKRLGP